MILHRLLYVFLFIAFSVAIAFSPSIFAELTTVDDFDAYHAIANSGFSLKSLFFPQTADGAYYRPMIGLSYLFDKHVWLLDTRFMHLDNIFFHVVNAWLVYLIVRKLLPPEKRHTSYLPVFASLMFGLHPITSESVNWISGRTDVFAGTSMLASTLFLIRFKQNRRALELLFAFLLLVPGLLVKETVVAFFLSAVCILSARDREDIPDEVIVFGRHIREIGLLTVFSVVAVVVMVVSYNVWLSFVVSIIYLASIAVIDLKSGNKLGWLYTTLSIIAVGVGAVWGFFAFRSVVFSSNLGSIGRTINLIFNDLNYSLQTFLGAAGFYVKKFFLPLPLNLAIREIDPFYNLLGVVVLLGCLYLVRRNTISSAFFLTGVVLFLPALPLALGTVTWTAYAERYIYVSSAFWVIALVIYLDRTITGQTIRCYYRYGALVLVVVMFAVSLHRSLIWKSNLTLWRDTVAKSPGFKMIYVDYMLALIKSGDLQEAKRQYTVASAIPSVGYYEMLDLAMASALSKEGNYPEAARYYEMVIKETKGKSAAAYDLYREFLRERLAGVDIHDLSGMPYFKRKLECLDALFELRKEPFLMYRAGELALVTGDNISALRYFKRVIAASPQTSSYHANALKLVKKLEDVSK